MFSFEENEIIENFLYNLLDLSREPIWDVYPDELNYTVQETEYVYGNNKTYIENDEGIEVESISTEYSSENEQPCNVDQKEPTRNLKPGTVPNDPEQGQTSAQPKREELDHEFTDPPRDYEIRRKPTKEDFSNFSIPNEYRTRSDTLKVPDSLDLDCQNNRNKILDTWASAVGLVILTNDQINKDTNIAHSYLSHKMSGNVKTWYSNLSIDQRRIIANGAITGYDYLTNLVKKIHSEFIGLNKESSPEQVRLREHHEAEYHLQNMTICDPCLLDNFFCEYEKFYHKLAEEAKPHYREMFLNKLPGIMGDECRKLWKEKDNSIPDTLAGAKRIVDEYVQKECEFRTKIKQLKLKTKICCSKLDPKLPGHYGCNRHGNKSKKTKYIKSRKRFYKKKYNRRSYDKSNYSQKRKFFRRKNLDKNKKAKYCPKGKATCRCWLCNEEGHYANACPRRQSSVNKNDRKIKLLEFAFANNLEPIESSDSETESFYYLSDIEDKTSETRSSSDHNWYSDTDTDSESE